MTKASRDSMVQSGTAQGRCEGADRHGLRAFVGIVVLAAGHCWEYASPSTQACLSQLTGVLAEFSSSSAQPLLAKPR